MAGYAADGLIDTLYHLARKKNALAAIPPEKLPQVIGERRRALRQCLGLGRLNEVEQPLTVTPVDRETREGYALERYDMAFLPRLTTPLFLVRPDSPSLTPQGGHRAVLYLNGHGGSCADALAARDSGAYHKRLPIALAQAGYLVAVPELAGFGEVVKRGYREPELGGCYALTTQLQLLGISMGALRCLQAMRTLDWLLGSRPVGRLAACGISGGGLVTMLLCALERRLDAGAVFCYANTFYDSVMAMRHCVDNYMPGILAEVGEMADILALAAPMPLLLSGGEQDAIFPVQATRQAFADVQAVYDRLGAGGGAQLEIFSGGHELSTARVFEFLENAL